MPASPAMSLTAPSAAPSTAAQLSVQYPALDPDQLRVVAHRTGTAAVAASAGCHRAGQLIMMADGTLKPIESIVVGEQVMGPDSTPRNVLELCRGRQQMVRIVPATGAPWFVNLSHVLTVEDTSDSLLNRMHRATHPWAERAIDVTVHALIAFHAHWLPALRLIRAKPLNGTPEYVPFGIDSEGTNDEENYFGFRLDGDHRYLLGDFTVTHNSGKTAAATARAIALVEEGVSPASIVTLAFNANAKETLRQRLSAHPATAAHAAQMAWTFHGFAFSCVRLVRPEIRVLAQSAAEAERSGRDDALVARDVAKEVWRALGGWRKGAEGPRPSWAVGVDFEDVFDAEPGARERLFPHGWPRIGGDPEAMLAALKALHLKEVSQPTLRALANFMGPYQDARRKLGAIDFSDMLLGLGHYIKVADPKVMGRLGKIQHLQVDEAQDGNELRWFIAKTIASLGACVLAVGDLRQSIAGFAGAEPALFKDWWDNADQQYTLPRNYRSAAKIVAAGNAVAHGESWNVGGASIAARADLGEGKVRVTSMGALSIGVEIATAIQNGTYAAKDVTVLARTRATLETTAFALRAKGVPCRISGGGSAWNSRDGKAIRSYLAFADGDCSDTKSLVGALNRPLRYVSSAKLSAWCDGPNLDLRALSYDARNAYKPARAVQAAFNELQNSTWAERLATIEAWLLQSFADDAREAKVEFNAATSERAEFMLALVEMARVAGSREALAQVVAAERVDDKADAVVLSTIHKAKGDQWGTVYVTGLRKGIFPHAKAITPAELDEEARLLYVAVTRPVHSLIVDVADSVGFDSKLGAIELIADAKSLAALAESLAPELPEEELDEAGEADESDEAPLSIEPPVPLTPAPSAPPLSELPEVDLTVPLRSSAPRPVARPASPQAPSRSSPPLIRTLGTSGVRLVDLDAHRAPAPAPVAPVPPVRLVPPPALVPPPPAAPARKPRAKKVAPDAAPSTALAAPAAPASTATPARVMWERITGASALASSLTEARAQDKQARVVEVTLDDCAALLGSLDFAPDAALEKHSVSHILSAPVAVRGLPWTLAVHTSVLIGGLPASREDVLKVDLLDEKRASVLPRKALVQRSRNWRFAVLDALESVLRPHSKH